MTETSTSTTAETNTAEQTGRRQLYLELDLGDIQLLRWSMSATSNLLAAQEGHSIPKKESTALIAAMSELDEKIYNQVQPEEEPDSGYEQLTLF